MTTKIPPCPVDGTGPKAFADNHFRCEKCNTHVMSRQSWIGRCRLLLGRALRSHDIETMAQVDALVRNTKELFPGSSLAESIKDGE